MISGLFTRFIKLSLTVLLLPTFTGYGMEIGEDDKEFELSQAKDSNEVDFNYDLLATLPREILHRIMMLLSEDVCFEGLRYCYRNLHKITTKELVELDIS